ncbi:zinc finger protein 703 [Carlito syrichta]|uniref:Zinc finger protein 703 n=1 Tax=Carlito syrichta TaxID=1868482 RepID=A0A3Q0DHC5_CARSF|nr:zinc finger protein 703 [Carlito syrichta]
MSDSPAGSNPRTPESSGSGSGGGGKRPAVSLLPPADPLRQANRLPIRVLKMLSAHTGHLLHPEYLQPLSSTPVSPIELSFRVCPSNLRFLSGWICSWRLHWALDFFSGTQFPAQRAHDAQALQIPGLSSSHFLGCPPREGGATESADCSPSLESASRSCPTAPSPETRPKPTAGPYYSPYALYGQRLASASALGYQ